MTKNELRAEAAKLAKVMGVSIDEVMDLAEIGFSEMDTEVHTRMVISSAARDKCGKSDFCLRDTPEPIAYLDLDDGSEGVVEKFSDRRIIHRQFKLMQEARLEGRKVDQDEWDSEWVNVRNTIRVCVKNPLIRTLVCDTGTEMWELARLANFGKTDKVKSHHYGPVNKEFRDTIEMVKARKDLNAIFVHKVKKEYVDDKTTGKYERAGFGDMPFLVQINIEHYKTRPDDEDYDETEGPQFAFRVVNCRQNPEVDGMKFIQGRNFDGMGIGGDCSFKALGRMVFPESSKSDWE